MAIAVVFDLPGATSAQYDQIIRGLEQAGQTHPPGRLYHLAAQKPDGWYVCDVWESAEALDTFAQTLMPLAQQAGLAPQPQVYPVHNIIQPR